MPENDELKTKTEKLENIKTEIEKNKIIKTTQTKKIQNLFKSRDNNGTTWYTLYPKIHL